MKQELKDKWVTALRSGDYQQGKYYLKRDEDEQNASYCCLGVLCEVAGLSFEARPSILYSDSVFKLQDRGDYNSLRPKTRDDLELTLDAHTLLVQKNDLEGNSFNQIADWIEKHISITEEADLTQAVK